MSIPCRLGNSNHYGKQQVDKEMHNVGEEVTKEVGKVQELYGVLNLVIMLWGLCGGDSYY